MNSHENEKLYVLNAGLTRYKEAWEMQKRLVSLRQDEKIPDCLIVTEHHPVITMGRGTDQTNLLASKKQLEQKGVDLFEIERGGDITFHGPGQTVLYPIIDLHHRGRDVHKYLRDLESFVIATLNDLGLDAGIKEGLTGIWVDDHKVGAIGVAVSKWVTYHGLALNVTTDLDYFKLINPCGITDYPVGSISGLLGKRIDLQHVNDLLVESFADEFNYESETPASSELPIN